MVSLTEPKGTTHVHTIEHIYEDLCDLDFYSIHWRYKTWVNLSLKRLQTCVISLESATE